MTWRAPAAAASAVAVLSLLPLMQRSLGLPVYYLVFLYSLFFWITQATTWNMLYGFTGYFSFGQGAFFGGGVYTAAMLLDRLGFDLLASVPLAGLFGALLGLVMALVIFRMRKLQGEIFALFTLVVALGLSSFVQSSSYIDGGLGIALGSVPYPSWFGSVTLALYYLALVLALITVATAGWVQRSRFGRGLFAIRDDEPAAEAMGVPTFRYKTTVLVLSGFLAGASGGLHAVQINYITGSSVFSLQVPLYVIIMSVLGGTGHWAGPVVGATLVHTLSDRLSGVGLADLTQVLIGAVLIVVMLYLREGVYGRLRRRAKPAALVFALSLPAWSLIHGGVLDWIAGAMAATLLLLLLPPGAYAVLTGAVCGAVAAAGRRIGLGGVSWRTNR